MSDPNAHVQTLNHVANLLSAGAIVGCFLGALPPLAAAIAIIWYAIQIYESNTVQKHSRVRRIMKFRKRRQAKEKASVKTDTADSD